MPVGKSTKTIKSQKLFSVEEPIRAHKATKRVVRITDATYAPVGVEELCGKQAHLKKEEKEQLLILLKKYPVLFDGKLGTMVGPPVSISIKKGEEPVNVRPYPSHVGRCLNGKSIA